MTTPTLFTTLVSIHARLSPHGVSAVYRDDTLQYSHGAATFEIGDVASLIEDLVELDATQDQLADALSALALDRFGIEHDYGGHGLTIAVCGTGARP